MGHSFFSLITDLRVRRSNRVSSSTQLPFPSVQIFQGGKGQPDSDQLTTARFRIDPAGVLTEYIKPAQAPV